MSSLFCILIGLLIWYLTRYCWA